MFELSPEQIKSYFEYVLKHRPLYKTLYRLYMEANLAACFPSYVNSLLL